MSDDANNKKRKIEHNFPPDSTWGFSLKDQFGGPRSSFRFETNGTEDEFREFVSLCAQIAGFHWISTIEFKSNQGETYDKEVKQNDPNFSVSGSSSNDEEQGIS